ncbi:hypothetical protein LY76DRAFT_591428 [Colletotrichum caudatum]|nr:hypothetical protein LY76DRAFT_591428 [Colletotrichum caudatum]
MKEPIETKEKKKSQIISPSTAAAWSPGRRPPGPRQRRSRLVAESPRRLHALKFPTFHLLLCLILRVLSSPVGGRAQPAVWVLFSFLHVFAPAPCLH